MSTSNSSKPDVEKSSVIPKVVEQPKSKSTLDESKAISEVSEPPKSKSLLEGNGFQIIKKIGDGSYSKVKLAYSDSHKTKVAIKVVSKYHVPDEFLRKFLYNEIKVVKFLKHENIIKYYQSIESSHRLYVIMQYAENGSILDLIHKEKRLSEARACHFIRQIIAGLEYCHSQGVCHRDIKCENILLDENDVVKLIDFGFAKSYKTNGKSLENDIDLAASAHTHHSKKKSEDPLVSETYCGSYAYASPEILKGIPYDPFKSDVWAMGCVLYAMVFGRLPFDDRDPTKLIKQVSSPVSFPPSLEASDSCKDCIRRILAPLKIRHTIATLKSDPWINSTHLDQSNHVPPRRLPTR